MLKRSQNRLRSRGAVQPTARQVVHLLCGLGLSWDSNGRFFQRLQSGRVTSEIPVIEVLGCTNICDFRKLWNSFKHSQRFHQWQREHLFQRAWGFWTFDARTESPGDERAWLLKHPQFLIEDERVTLQREKFQRPRGKVVALRGKEVD